MWTVKGVLAFELEDYEPVVVAVQGADLYYHRQLLGSVED
jgi:hypothetical protein